MKRLEILALLTLATAAQVQAQDWEFDVVDFGGDEGKMYQLGTKTPGTVFGCFRNSGNADITFACRSKDSRIQTIVVITECEMNIGQPVFIKDKNFLVSTDQYRKMSAKGGLTSIDGKDVIITANLSDVQRFHAMILGSDGAFPIEIELGPGVVIRTEHYFDNPFGFQEKFDKFPSQCRM